MIKVFVDFILYCSFVISFGNEIKDILYCPKNFKYKLKEIFATLFIFAFIYFSLNCFYFKTKSENAVIIDHNKIPVAEINNFFGLKNPLNKIVYYPDNYLMYLNENKLYLSDSSKISIETKVSYRFKKENISKYPQKDIFFISIDIDISNFLKTKYMIINNDIKDKNISLKNIDKSIMDLKKYINQQLQEFFINKEMELKSVDIIIKEIEI